MIKVISQSTAERKAETIELFNQCKPYLDEGRSLAYAVKQVKGMYPVNQKNGWYRDLIDYAISQGINHHERKWQRSK